MQFGGTENQQAESSLQRPLVEEHPVERSQAANQRTEACGGLYLDGQTGRTKMHSLSHHTTRWQTASVESFQMRF